MNRSRLPKFLRPIVLGAGCLSLVFWLAVPCRAEDRVAAYLDSALSDFSGDQPGAAIVIREGDVILHQRTVGLARLTPRTPVRPTTNFRLASVTKQFTAMAILQLAEEGRLDLNDPLSRFFPQLAPWGDTISLRHLLWHTSGIVDYESVMPKRMDNQLLDADVLDLVAQHPRTYFPPGTRFRYSNTGYALLALVVEHVSGKSFANFLADHIFAPLGMNNTVAYQAGVNAVPHRAYGYRVVGDGRDPSYEDADQSATRLGRWWHLYVPYRLFEVGPSST